MSLLLLQPITVSLRASRLRRSPLLAAAYDVGHLGSRYGSPQTPEELNEHIPFKTRRVLITSPEIDMVED